MRDVAAFYEIEPRNKKWKIETLSTRNFVSKIPEVNTRHRKISWWVGLKSSFRTSSTRSRKYLAQSINWYSFDLSKHSCTPGSFHSAEVASQNCGGYSKSCLEHSDRIQALLASLSWSAHLTGGSTMGMALRMVMMDSLTLVRISSRFCFFSSSEKGVSSCKILIWKNRVVLWSEYRMTEI